VCRVLLFFVMKMKKLILTVWIWILSVVWFASAQVSMNTSIINFDTYQWHMWYVDDWVVLETQVCNQNPWIYTWDLFFDFSWFVFSWTNLNISDDFSKTDLVVSNIINTWNIDVHWNNLASSLTLSGVVIPACANTMWIIRFYVKLNTIYDAWVAVGIDSSVISGGVSVVSDSYSVLTTKPVFNYTISIDPSDRKVVSGAPVKVTFDITNNTYRAVSIPADIFDANNNIDLDVDGFVCDEDVQQIVPNQNARQLKPNQTLTCTYDGTVNNNNFGTMNLNHWLLNDLEIPVLSPLFSMHEELNWIANITATGELISGDPHAYGDLVQYKFSLTNDWSANADNYRVYMDFPVDYLRDYVVTLPGSSTPLLLNQEAWTNFYYVENGLQNIPIGATREFIVSAYLKDWVNHDVFENRIWLENLPQYVQNNNNAQDEVIIPAEYLEINFAWYMTPTVQYAISGTEISFDIMLANNWDLWCTWYIDYILPNNQIEFASASDDHFSTSVHYKTDIWVPAHTIDDNVTINAKIIDPDGVWADDSLFITLNGTYNCGAWDENFTDQIEIEPIAYINVDKKLTSVNPSTLWDVVTYSIVIRNDWSKSAEIYRLYDLFPGDDLLLWSTSLWDPNQAGIEYYRDNAMTDLVILAWWQLEVVVDGVLLDDTLLNSFDNVARVEMFESVWPASVLSDSETVVVEHRNVDVSVVSNNNPFYAISGTDIDFNISLENNGSTICSGTTTYHYSLANSISAWINPLHENMLAEFSLNPWTSVDFNNIDWQVVIPSWVDDSFYIEVITNYICAGVGPETVVTRLEIQPIPDVVVTKELVSWNPNNYNELVQYRITLKNIGSAVAHNYSLYDDFPKSLLYLNSRFNNVAHLPDFVSDLWASVEYSWSWSYLTLNPGASLSILLDWTLRDNYCSDSSVDNTARVDFIPQYSVSNDSDTATGVVESADLRVSIEQIGNEPEFLNDPVSFRVRYGNSWNIAANNVNLSWFIGNGLYNFDLWIDFASDISLWSVAPNWFWEIIITWYLNSNQYAPGMSICLDVDIYSDVEENLCGNYLNNHVLPVCHTVTWEIVDLWIEKTLLTDVLTVGVWDDLTYRLHIYNTGLYSASNVVVTDTFPLAFIYSSNNSNCVSDALSNKVTCSIASLGVNEHQYILITGTLGALPAHGITLVNTWEISFNGREYNLGNNVYASVDTIPGLADIELTKTVTSSNPSLEWDTIIYSIVYRNIWYRVAENIKIYDNFLFGGLALDMWASKLPLVWDPVNLSGYRGGGNLLPWESRTINVVAKLDDKYEAETLLPNIAWAETTSPQIWIWNDTDIATWKIESLQDITISIVAENLTHLDMSMLDPVEAVSGDTVSFILHYVNSGNVSLTNALVQFYSKYRDWTTPSDLALTSWIIPYLPYGASGTIVVTGIVWPQNYQYIDGVANIYESPTSTEVAATDTARVVEPLGCGDWFITWNEQCDMNGSIWDVLPGQVCDIVQDNPSLWCVLETRFVVNTGCIDYGYFMWSAYFTGVYCSNILPVPVDRTACDDVSITSRIEDWTWLDINFVCNSVNWNSATMISMDCWNWTFVQSVGSQLVGTCSYTWTYDVLSEFTGQCKVSNDLSNPNCVMPISFEPIASDTVVCKDLEPLDGIVLVVDENDSDGDLNFMCYTQGGTGTLEIDCDYDWSSFDVDGTSDDGVTQYEYTCNYDRSVETTYNVACRVQWEPVEDVCTELIMVDERSLWYCGDGELDGWEQCDLGWSVDQQKTIYNYLDNNDVLAPVEFRDNGSYCKNCAISHDTLVYTPPMCFSVSNANISVQQKEILPFRWNLLVKKGDLEEWYDCSPGDIDKDMTCEFVIIDGKDDRYEFTLENCLDNIDERDGNTALESFEKHVDFAETLDTAAWKYKLDVSKFVSEDGPFGEYKLRLERVMYDYCNSKGEREEGIVVDRVCEINFTVTNPYLIQKSAFGATKAYDEEGNDVSLDEFYAINPGDDNYKILERTDLSALMEVTASDYSLDSNLKDMITKFVDKYGVMAINVDGVAPVSYEWGGTITEIRKVPGQQIYVFKWNGKMILKQKTDYFPGESYSIIVKWMDVEIQGSVKTNWMYLVVKWDNGEWWKVTFGYAEEDDCNAPQIVNGIFISEWWFGLEPEANVRNDDEADLRCLDWSLYVNGVLIWNEISDLVKNRRSHLNDRFVVSSDNEDKIKEQRREKLINGASVLIEYNPSLWTDLPPGAKEFTESLVVYKQ